MATSLNVEISLIDTCIIRNIPTNTQKYTAEIHRSSTKRQNCRIAFAFVLIAYVSNSSAKEQKIGSLADYRKSSS